MAEFNPDEYLAEKEKESSFDPDEYLAEKTKEESSLKQLGRAFTDYLPAAGSIAGGAIGTATGGFMAGPFGIAPGLVEGSALGAAAGKALENIIEQNIYNEPKTVSSYTVEPIIEGVLDVPATITGEKIISPIVGLAGKGLKKVASAFSGVPEKSIETYAKNLDEVNKIDDVALEADKIRQSANRAIESFKNTQNSRIAKDIAAKSELPVDVTNAVNFLEQKIAQKNKKITPEIVSELERELNIIKAVSQFDEATGIYTTEAKNAAELKSKFQGLGEYTNDQGKTLKKRDYSGFSFTGAAREIRQNLNKVLPDYATANLEIEKLRQLDSRINKNIIKEGAPFNAMVSIGSGNNPMQRKNVENLSNILGRDMITPMEKLAAAQNLNEADLLSSLKTGRAMVPLIAGGAANVLGGPIAGATSFLATTPQGIKTSIRIGKAASKIGLTPTRMSSQVMREYGSDAVSDVFNVLTTMSPYDREQYIKKDNSITPTQKAILLKQNRNAR